MTDKIITTNKLGNCYFKILPHDMKEVDYPYYQWRIGKNVITPQDQPNTNFINVFGDFCLMISRFQDIPDYNYFCTLKICWLGIPESAITRYYGCHVLKSTEAIIYRVKTGEELRREDSPLYRMFISYITISRIPFRTTTQYLLPCNDFDWTLFVLANYQVVGFDIVPKVYRTSKYICIAAQLVAPGNTLFVVKDDNIVKSLKQFSSRPSNNNWISYYPFCSTAVSITHTLSQLYNPNPVVAQRNLINWVVKEYNRLNNTAYSIQL